MMPDRAPAPGEVWHTAHGVKLRPPTAGRSYYRLDYTLAGRRHQPSVGRDWQTAWAEACRADLLLAAEAGHLGVLPVTALADAWVEDCTRGWSLRYQDLVAGHLRRFIRPTIGELACLDLRKDDIRRLLLVPEYDSVRVQLRTVTGSMLSWGREYDWIERDVMPSKSKAEKADAARPVTYVELDETPDHTDVARLLEVAGPRILLPVAVGAYMGLRQGEVLGARGGQVVRGGTLHVDTQVQELASGKLVRTLPKYRKIRDVPIPTRVAGIDLRAALEARAAEVGRDGLLFPSPRGLTWRRGGFNDTLERARDAAAFRWTFHALRHHYCRWLLSRGVEPKDVSLVAGHANVSTTLTMYVRHTASAHDRIRAAVG